jgi:ABC transport system ATP-binding/permease protein
MIYINYKVTLIITEIFHQGFNIINKICPLAKRIFNFTLNALSMQLIRYLQSFELLITLLLSNKESGISNIKFLKNLAKNLDSYFLSVDFSQLFELKTTVKTEIEPKQDHLFNFDTDLNFINLNTSILNLKERLYLYAYLCGWIAEIDINNEILDYCRKILRLEIEETNQIGQLFKNKPIINNAGLNYQFTVGPKNNLESELEGVWIDAHKPKHTNTIDLIELENLKNYYNVLYISKLKAFLIISTDKSTFLTKQRVQGFCNWEIIGPGEKIDTNKNDNIDYQYLKNELFTKNINEPVSMQVNSLTFSYANGKGIKELNLNIKSGSLIGVIGKEGTGKSTLLKILAGDISKYKGELYINGYNHKNELYHIKNMIGYVSDDDLLYEELTVYENLYFTAKLYLGRISDQQIRIKIDNLLKDIGVEQLRDCVVGSILEKHLQPGQRRLLNIALELIREPQVLIVDNALVPINLNDSSKIIELLSDYSYKGNIVITSITQCSGEISSLFDNVLILDDGGFPVYYGKLTEAYHYFNNLLGIKSEDHLEVDPEMLINLINSVDYKTNDRYITPFVLNQRFHQLNEQPSIDTKLKKAFAGNMIHTPTLDRQYVIFSIRNFKNKISRSRELAYTILVSPILAIILSVFLRDSNGNDYSFSTNDNIPPYFFISILIAFFLGLTQSVNEIYRERKLNKKHEYLNLSRFSYINSKITYLFAIAIIQSLMFVLIANTILSIKGFYLWHWLILFSSQAFAIIIGLIFSDTHHKIENIYIKSIPIAILVQIIFGGCFFNLDKLHPNPKTPTPLISDLVVARWGYEALMVQQFKENNYEKNFYELDRYISQGIFIARHFIPSLDAQINHIKNNLSSKQDTCEVLLKSVCKTIKNFPLFNEIFPYENIDKINIDDFNLELASDITDYLEYINISMYTVYENAVKNKDSLELKISKGNKPNYLDDLKKENYNYAVASIVANDVPDKIRYIDSRPVQVSNPIFQFPVNDFGREPMYLPEKKFNNETINTIEFNISIIWLLNVFLYIILLTDFINKIKRLFLTL